METKACQNCKNNFAIEPEDFVFYEKMKVPPPTFCPGCRDQRRLAWRNNISLYNRTCNLCGESVVTLYSKESGINVFCNKCWWNDKWDPYDYGVEYDFSKPFFTQFKELMQKVPHLATVNDNGVASKNCEYTHDCWFAKNCYMVFYAWKIENVSYSTFMVDGGKDIIDCLNIMNGSEWIYECINTDLSYKVKYSQLCIYCTESQFLYDCRSCTDCFMCGGLRNKRYCFKNVQYSKEEYEKILASYKLDTFSGVEKARAEFDEFILKIPRRFTFIVQSKDCTGDLLFNGKDSKHCFMIKEPENCKYYDNGTKPKDCYDMSTAGELTECYEGITLDHSNQNKFGVFSVKSQDIRYTQHCHSSKYLFGCVSVKHGEYSILNKKYTKEEYSELVPKIIEHMNEMPYVDKNGNEYRYGEFFPIEHSPFGYNETVAPEQYPLSKEEVLAKGYNWQDNLQRTVGKETIVPENIPESINDVTESITDEILACVNCKRNYKIIPEEFLFYQRMNVPIPRKCFHCRHASRIKRRNPFHLWHRSCMNVGCSNEFETSYAPDRPEIIYCESCYNKEFN